MSLVVALPAMRNPKERHVAQVWIGNFICTCVQSINSPLIAPENHLKGQNCTHQHQKKPLVNVS